MTTTASDGQSTMPTRKRRRIFPFFFTLVQIAFLAWIIGGASSSSGGTAKDCAGLTGQGLQACLDAGHAGTAIGVGLIIVLWVAADAILFMTWLVLHLTRRR